MAYASNYYNYQIGVIFAILIGGLLLLTLILGGIYFVCVVNMRGGDEKRRTRTPTSTRPWPGPQASQPPYTSFQNPPMNTIPAEYPPRTPVPPAGGGYSQQPLVQPYNSELVQGTRIRELQPEFSYQQGPTQWTTVSPIREGPYPISPGPGIASGYHMSSV